MPDERMRIVIIGLTITSSWGNGHATTYRGLVRELERRGHDVLFLEHDKPWYASHRDMPHPPFGTTALYSSADELRERWANAVRRADAVIVGSYVPQGIEVGQWVTQIAQGATAFYDIDTPVTLANLSRGTCEYLSTELIARFDLYLSFTGGPTLDRLEREFGSPRAVALYCSVDPEIYYPEPQPLRWELGYLGTYSADRQPGLEKLLIEPAREVTDKSFVVAGPQFPLSIQWPGNVERVEHIPPSEHRAFYNRQSFTLNLTRADMRAAGYSPSVRLFEAAACGVPIISDAWEGIDTLLRPGDEIILANDTGDVIHALTKIARDERRAIGERARRRVLSEHTAEHRAAELESYLLMTRVA